MERMIGFGLLNSDLSHDIRPADSSQDDQSGIQRFSTERQKAPSGKSQSRRQEKIHSDEERQ